MDFHEYADVYCKETAEIAKNLDRSKIARLCQLLSRVKAQGGRVFFAGVGGGAGNGSHAANDFNKIAGISAVCLTDNSPLLTALTNDEGWISVFQRQLAMHQIGEKDCLFVFSVSGGSSKFSENLVSAIAYAKERGAKVVGVVGKDTGATAREADVCIIVPELNPSRITPHAEDYQIILTHLVVNALAQEENSDVV